jgi:7-cyano-7-deazaguanine reductase
VACCLPATWLAPTICFAAWVREVLLREALALQQATTKGQNDMEKEKIETAKLETFPNPHPEREYEIEIVAPEFTSLCPRTGQPDFGVVTITYTPDKLCVELKSLKLYLQSYRNVGAFYEDVTNRILNALVAELQPAKIKIVARFTPRGGITTTITTTHEAGKKRG